MLRTITFTMALLLIGTVGAIPGVGANQNPDTAKSCSGENGESCEFECEEGDIIYVSAGGLEMVAGSCGGASAGCFPDDLTLGEQRDAPNCNSSSNPTRATSSGTGTCAGTGTGTFSCSAD